jgi:hypothetical protein
VTVVACAVGRLDPAGGWIGFAPTLEDDYALVVGTDDSSTALAPAESDELIALAIAYFADELPEPPEALAATHGDVAALVRHVAVGEAEFDDGLAADVVVGRLGRCLSSDEEPETRLRRRAAELLGERPHHRE